MLFLFPFAGLVFNSSQFQRLCLLRTKFLRLLLPLSPTILISNLACDLTHFSVSGQSLVEHHRDSTQLMGNEIKN